VPIMVEVIGLEPMTLCL